MANRTAFVLLAVIGLVVATPGCLRSSRPPAGEEAVQPDYAAAIEAVLRQEHDAHSLIHEESELEDLENYIEAMGRIDLRQCPEDFQQAFLNHKYAWNDVSSFLSRYQDSFGALTLFLDSISGVALQRAEELNKTIEDTWRECEVVALRHGANTAEYFQKPRGLPGFSI
jgi:hypothetical protein